MSRKCQITGKKTTSGNNRPFSLKITKRTFRPNLFKRRVKNPETGEIETMKISAKAIRTMKKKGLIVNEYAKSPEEKAEAKAKKGATSKAGEGKHVKKEKLTPKQKKELVAAKEAEAKATKSVAEEKIDAKEEEKEA